VSILVLDSRLRVGRVEHPALAAMAWARARGVRSSVRSGSLSGWPLDGPYAVGATRHGARHWHPEKYTCNPYAPGPFTAQKIGLLNPSGSASSSGVPRSSQLAKPTSSTSTRAKSAGFTCIDLNVALIASEARLLF
jgi:hypothetical protein